MPLSVTLITRNEEKNIAAALESVRWADEIIVVDSESSDSTVEIALRYTPRVIVRSWSGYAAQKQFASDQASGEWVLSIDADERVTEQLAAEIKRVINDPSNKYDGFHISRRNYYLGRPVLHSGWSPDFQLRLYKRKLGRWIGDFVHESVRLEGSAGYLQGKLDHFTIQSVTAHHQRLDRYTSLASEDLNSKGYRTGLGDLLLRPPLAFLRSYIFRLGFLDGTAGVVIAYFAAYYVFLKFAKAWEREVGSRKSEVGRD